MANHHTDGTIVESLVSLRIEERILQYSCRETNLVGSRVIVCVHGLRSHVPLIAVHRFASLLLDVHLRLPHLRSLNILIVALRRVYGQLRVILPLVGIANLHIECRQFLMCVRLCRVAHPCLSIYALSQCHLQVVHQLLHDLLRRCREVALTVHLTQRLAHGTLYLIRRTLPQRIVLLPTRHRLTEEIEVSLTDLISQIARSTHDNIPLHIGSQVIGIHGSKQFVGTLHKLRLPHDHFLDVFTLYTIGICHSLQWNVRISRLEFLQRHLIVVGLRVTQFRTAL